MSRIELRNVAKSYGKVDVLNNISFSIDDGEFVVLVGPSGCGKSTLLRMIAGLEDITAGEVVIAGHVANRVPAKQRDLAMVFQSYALYPHMKVADNMSFSLKLAHVPKAEIKERVAVAADILGLTELLDRVPRELSGGQRQRVAMGRAIVRDPQAFLFDEPLSNLDAKLRVKMRSEIKKLHKRLGKTMIYVTHDQTEAMTMAEKIVVLNGGGIAQMGSPLEIYRNPNSAFVAGFIGSPEINFIAAKTTDRPRVTVAVGLDLPLGLDITLPAGRDVTYGIRPQHITLGDTGIEAQVLVVEPTGEEQNLTLNLAGHEITVVATDATAYTIGETVLINIQSDKVLLFDPQNGMRLL